MLGLAMVAAIMHFKVQYIILFNSCCIIKRNKESLIRVFIFYLLAIKFFLFFGHIVQR